MGGSQHVEIAESVVPFTGDESEGGDGGGDECEGKGCAESMDVGGEDTGWGNAFSSGEEENAGGKHAGRSGKALAIAGGKRGLEGAKSPGREWAGLGATLIVCPSTLLVVWQEQLKIHTVRFRPLQGYLAHDKHTPPLGPS